MTNDASAFYTIAVSDEKLNYHTNEISFIYTWEKIIELVDRFNWQNFSFLKYFELTTNSEVIKMKTFLPENINVQHLPVTKQTNKTENSLKKRKK